MNNNKKTAFGIVGAAAATLITVGLAAPAMASTPSHDSSDSSSHSSSSTSSSTSQSSYEQLIQRVTEILNGNTTNAPLVISPQVGIGDVASGNAIGSGNTSSVPVLSGNDTALASGNTTSTGNGTSVLNGSGNGNSASNSAGNGNSSHVTGPTVATTTGDIGDQVNTTVDGILGNLGLSSH